MGVYVEAITRELEKTPELKQSVLTKEQRVKQTELARKIIAQMKAEGKLG